MVGMNQLFIAAGLQPRTMTEVATSAPAEPIVHPRRPR